MNYHVHPNLFAYFMVMAWPLITVWLFTRLPPARALIWTVLGAYLALPLFTEIKIPTIPAFNKDSVPNMAAAACFFSLRGSG